MGRYVQVDAAGSRPTRGCEAKPGSGVEGRDERSRQTYAWEAERLAAVEAGAILTVGEWMMRFLVALIGGLFVFVTVAFLCGLVLLWLTPAEWARTEVSYQGYSGNIVTVVSVLVGALGGMYGFTSLLRMKASGKPQSQQRRRQPEMQQETNLLHHLS